MTQQHQLMTLDEKFAILGKAIELKKAGDLEGYDRLSKTVPLPAYMAQVAKKTLGLDFLLNGGWNLAEVEAELGPDFLSK